MNRLCVIYTSPDDPTYPYFTFHEQIMSVGYSDTKPILFIYLKIIRVVRGSCVWMLAGRGFRLNAGDYLILNNIDSRALAEIDGDSPLIIEQAIFLPSSLPPRLGCIDFFYYDLDSRVVRPDAPYYRDIDECFRQLSREARGKQPLRDNLIYAELIRLTSLLSRSLGLTARATRAGEVGRSRTISEIMLYITQHYSDSELGLDTLSHLFGFTKARLAAEFKRFSGISISRYIALNRVQNVILRLRTQDENILDAALECGFGSSSGFYKTFHEITGKTPSEFVKSEFERLK